MSHAAPLKVEMQDAPVEKKTRGLWKSLKRWGGVSRVSAKNLKGRVTEIVPASASASSMVFRQRFGVPSELPNRDSSPLSARATRALELAGSYAVPFNELVEQRELRGEILEKSVDFEVGAASLEQELNLPPDSGTRGNLERILDKENSKLAEAVLYDPETAGRALGLAEFDKRLLYTNVALRSISLNKRFESVRQEELDRAEKTSADCLVKAQGLVTSAKRKLKIEGEETPAMVMEKLQKSRHSSWKISFFRAWGAKKRVERYEKYNREVGEMGRRYLLLVEQINSCAAIGKKWEVAVQKLQVLSQTLQEIGEGVKTYGSQSLEIDSISVPLQNVALYLTMLRAGKNVIYPFQMLGNVMEDIQLLKKDPKADEQMIAFCERAEGICREHMLQRVEAWEKEANRRLISVEEGVSLQGEKKSRELFDELAPAKEQLEKWIPYFEGGSFEPRFTSAMNAIRDSVELGPYYVSLFDFSVSAQRELSLDKLTQLEQDVGVLKAKIKGSAGANTVRLQALEGCCTALLLSLESQRMRHEREYHKAFAEYSDAMKGLGVLLDTLPEGSHALDSEELFDQVSEQIALFSQLQQKMGRLIDHGYVTENQVVSLNPLREETQKIQRFLEGMQRLAGGGSSIRTADVEQLRRIQGALPAIEGKNKWVAHLPGWISALENRLQETYLANKSPLVEKAKEELEYDKHLLIEAEKKLTVVGELQRGEPVSDENIAGPFLSMTPPGLFAFKTTLGKNIKALQESIAAFPEKCEEALGLKAQDRIEASLKALDVKMSRSQVLLESLFSYWEGEDRDNFNSLISNDISSLKAVQSDLRSLEATEDWNQLQESGKKVVSIRLQECEDRLNLLTEFASLRNEVFENQLPQERFKQVLSNMFSSKGELSAAGVSSALDLSEKANTKIVQLQKVPTQQGLEVFQKNLKIFTQNVNDAVEEFILETQQLFKETPQLSQGLQDFNARVEQWKAGGSQRVEALSALFLARQELYQLRK